MFCSAVEAPAGNKEGAGLTASWNSLFEMYNFRASNTRLTLMNDALMGRQMIVEALLRTPMQSMLQPRLQPITRGRGLDCHVVQTLFFLFNL